MISSASSVSLIFLTLVHFFRVTLVHLTASSRVSWTVSPDESVFPNASVTITFSDIGMRIMINIGTAIRCSIWIFYKFLGNSYVN